MIYARTGLLAVDPSAIGVEATAPYEPAQHGTVAVVGICGPLDSTPNPYCDDYASIVSRVQDACATDAGCIVLLIDSPGGAVSGLFDAAESIREVCAAANKRLVAYVSGQCCSAAYALACVAESIATCSTGLAGSIGVLDCRVDVSSANDAAGVRFSMVTSGARKVDGHPCVAVSDGEIAARQRVVDDLAEVFFNHVQSARGLDARSLQAAVYVGESARSAMLVDSVLGYREFLAALQPGPGAAEMTYEELMAALAEMAKGEGPDADMAKAAVDKLAEHEEPGEVEPEAAMDEPAIEASTVAQLAQQVQTLSARIGELTATREADDRKALLSSRDDLGPELVDVLKSKPLAEVRAIVGALPRRAKFATKTASAPVVTLGEGQANARATSPEFERADTLMGIGAQKSTGTVRTEHSLILGAARKGA
jgi:ClpP class serine protease